MKNVVRRAWGLVGDAMQHSPSAVEAVAKLHMDLAGDALLLASIEGSVPVAYGMNPLEKKERIG